jgi:glucose-1-phosphate thymidylyltransferase
MIRKERRVAEKWKAIILAGGSGTRLFPITRATSKQLMPIYDKPMIYYPLSVLMMAGIRDILVISTPQDLPRFEQLLGDGTEIGLNINYAEQAEPKGIAQAFVIGSEFIGDSSVCLILGDNIFFGNMLPETLQSAIENTGEGASIFGYHVRDPERYGVVTFDEAHKVVDIEEKPAKPKSDYAVTGLYFYSNEVVSIARQLKPSDRGELEITDVNKAYLQKGKLRVELLGRGVAWLDTGTHDSLLAAGNFVQTVESRQGLKIACLEEIAYNMGYISAEQVRKLAEPLAKTGYGQYLLELISKKSLRGYGN